MEDCYFIISKEQTIIAICLDCNENQEGFYWEGSKFGYGVNDIVTCSICNKNIYKETNDSKDNI